MTFRGAARSIARFSAAGAFAFSLGACSGDTTTVILPPTEVLVASGDSQYGTVGQTLQTPLQVYVRTLTTQLPQTGTVVRWSVESGDAAIVGVPSTVTDSTGSARATVKLGSSTGDVVVRATAQGKSSAWAEFRLFTVDRPVLTALSETSAVPGSSVILTGANFSPSAEQNVVLFSGVRGRVTSASLTSLTVTVPACLPERSVDVSVQLGVVGSPPLPLAVGPGGDVTSLSVGSVADATDAAGYTCVTVPGAGGAQYLVMVHSASRVGAATHPFSLTGLGATLAAAPSMERSSVRRDVFDRGGVEDSTDAQADEPGADFDPDAQSLWDERLRGLEEEMTRDRRRAMESGGDSAPPVLAVEPRPVPSLNDIRTFQVFRNPGDFTEVTAIARFVGERAAFFVDVDAPGGGYTQADLRAFSEQFDAVIHPTITGQFGNVSDLDSNERIVILFTPAVNALTPRGATGFIGGFFFGLDLLPENTGSNAGEVFYALVPDQAGEFSDPRPKDALLELTPAILSHEFQHMVNFNERVLALGAEANEAVWLSEALAQYAEELVARRYDALGDPAKVEVFRDGTRERARRYLAATRNVSLLISAGSGSLEERGAGYLYITYLADRFGADLAGRLTRTTRTGVANVEAETGTDWAVGLSDWWAAVYGDGPGPEQGTLVYPTVDLRDFLGDPWPLVPSPLGTGDFSRTGSMRSSAIEYYIVNPAADGWTTLRLGGEQGGASALQAEMRMRVLRIQ